MYGDRGAGGSGVIEEFTINGVITGEIVHVYKEGRNLHQIVQIGAGRAKNIADIFNNRASLYANIEPGCAQFIDIGTGNAVVG